jgi:hypothetical protein
MVVDDEGDASKVPSTNTPVPATIPSEDLSKKGKNPPLKKVSLSCFSFLKMQYSIARILLGCGEACRGETS